jgi:hypothetical protein
VGLVSGSWGVGQVVGIRVFGGGCLGITAVQDANAVVSVLVSLPNRCPVLPGLRNNIYSVKPHTTGSCALSTYQRILGSVD